VGGVRDRDPPDSRVGNDTQAAVEMDAGVVPRVQHEPSDRIRCERTRLGQAGLLELPGVVDVSRQEDVEGRAVLNLRKEIAGRSECQRDVAGRLALETLGQGRHHRLQIGSCGDGQDCRRLRSARRSDES
jgi:hypothetical protein